MFGSCKFSRCPKRRAEEEKKRTTNDGNKLTRNFHEISVLRIYHDTLNVCVCRWFSHTQVNDNKPGIATNARLVPNLIRTSFEIHSHSYAWTRSATDSHRAPTSSWLFFLLSTVLCLCAGLVCHNLNNRIQLTLRQSGKECAKKKINRRKTRTGARKVHDEKNKRRMIDKFSSMKLTI